MRESIRRAWNAIGAAAGRVGAALAPWRRGWRWELLLGVLVLVLLGYTRMFPEVSVPNERTRVYLTMAMVDQGSLSIDEPMHRFGPLLDRAKRDGRYYTDKAPG